LNVLQPLENGLFALGQVLRFPVIRREGRERGGLPLCRHAPAPRARRELEGRRITTTSGHSVGAYLAWNGERLGLAWCDDSDGQHEIYFQTLDTAGQAQRAARRVTHTAASSWVPAIKPWKDGFALVWNEYEFPAGEAHQRDDGRAI
jgi:hypothetical protein